MECHTMIALSFAHLQDVDYDDVRYGQLLTLIVGLSCALVGQIVLSLLHS
jgi:hypothetical protein